jgi:sugar lactone lactonase YvrE
VTPDERLRHALRSTAPAVSNDAAGWEQVTSRAGAMRVQRRVLGAAAAVIVAVAVSLGVLAATGSFDSGASSRSIVATPTPTSTPVGDDIVASLDHSIVVLSSDDGHVVRTLAEGLESPGAVAVSPDGATVYYTRSARACVGNLPMGTGGLTKVGIKGGSPQDVIGGAADPLVSPDGRWLAYSFATCDAPDAQHVGLLDLTTGEQHWPLDGTGPEHAVPLVWSADSQNLLYLGGDGDVFRLDGIPQPAAPVNLTTQMFPVTTATFTHEASLLIARQVAQTVQVQHWDQGPGGIGIRFIAEGTSPSAMSFGDGDRLLLSAPDGVLSVQEGSVGNESTWQSGTHYATDPRLLRRDVHGAAWIPTVASVTTTTTVASTTVPATTPPTVPSGSDIQGARSIAVDGDGRLVFTKDQSHQVLRRSADGTVTVVAGTGTPGSAGDGGPATDAQLDEPAGIAVGPDDTIYIADRAAHRVRAVDADGTITTVAGTGEQGALGDGGAAIDAQLDQPIAVAVAPTGDLYVVDASGVRHLTNGTITTIVRSGPGATSGLVVDGQPTALFLSAIAVDLEGNLYVGDSSPKLVAKYRPDGTLLQVWKDLYVSQAGLATAPDGSIFVADYGMFSVDRIGGDVLNTIKRFSLGSIPGLDGVLRPAGVAVGGDGTVYAVDTGGAAGTSGALISISTDGTVTVLKDDG